MSEPTLRFWLNDRIIEPGDIAGTTTLLRFLRDNVNETATKEGCAEGDCGACTVAILEQTPKGPAYRAINSCLVFLPMLQNKRVYTAEGLRERQGMKQSPSEGYHPAQQAMVSCRASQCGYCTPGIVMSLFAACYRDDIESKTDVDDQLAGNLCRCTGYRPIKDAAYEVSGTRPKDRFLAELNNLLPSSKAVVHKGKNGLSGDQLYLQPASREELLAAKMKHSEAVFVAGGTDLGLFVTKRHEHYPVVIGLEACKELSGITKTDAGWDIGATTTLTELDNDIGAVVPALRKHLRWFGARQIRNRATLGGNLMTASPIGDLAPLFVAANATVTLWGPNGDRTMPLEEFLSGYRSTELAADEVLAAIHLPKPKKDTILKAYKVSKRRELDISTVSMCASVDVEEGVVSAIRLSFGGVAPAAGARAKLTEQALLQKPWTEASIEAAFGALEQDFQPISDFRGSSEYRRLLCKNLLRGFFLETTQPNTDPAKEAGTIAAIR